MRRTNLSDIGEKTVTTEMLRQTFLDLLMPTRIHLYNFIKKTMNFSTDMDDIYQETLLKAFKYFNSYKRDRSFKTWIFTIAHNLIKDYIRQKKWLDLSQFEGENFLYEDPVKKEDVKKIYEISGQLKHHHREVFFLFYYNEFKISEISAITGLSKSNIKYILQSARKEIQKLLEVKNG